MKKLLGTPNGMFVLILLLGGLGTWPLWHFAYYNEDRVVPNGHAIEKAVEARHPDAEFCDLTKAFGVDISVDWVKSIAERGQAAILFVDSPEKFAKHFTGKGCVSVFRVSYYDRDFAGQRTYLASAEAGGFVAWEETYTPPRGWEIKAVSGETIIYNRNNLGWIWIGTMGIWMFSLVVVAACIFIYLAPINKPAAP